MGEFEPNSLMMINEYLEWLLLSSKDNFFNENGKI